MPKVERYTLPLDPPGQWVDMKVRLTHGDARRVEEAYTAALLPTSGSFNDREAVAEATLAAVEAYAEVYTVDWHVFDEDGNLLPFRPESWDLLPEEVHRAISIEAQERWKRWRREVMTPLEERAGSEPSPSARPAPSRTTRQKSRRG